MADQRESVLKFGYFISRDKHKIRYGRAGTTRGKIKGVVLLLNGRSEFMEKYYEVVSELTYRGYNVLSLDWRGQGLSYREPENRQKGYVETYDDYLNDLAIFYNGFVKTEELPVTILAHSMGGHIAMRFVLENQIAINRVVLVSPMVDINTSPFPWFIVRFLAKKACASGFSKAYVFGGSNYYPSKTKFKTNNLTHDPDRFLIEKNQIKKNSDLALGDVTWGWLMASFESIEILQTTSCKAKIETPILIISAEKESIVSTHAQKILCQKLQNCQFVSIPGAFHEILHETDDIRELFWNYFDHY
ncbi:MAG: alpha/beta hydrolase [Thermodesulfobacteriota bacterium]|nr:alpha/beta hydrolase [Thermodesulfobacteriota bacterium]